VTLQLVNDKGAQEAKANESRLQKQLADAQENIESLAKEKQELEERVRRSLLEDRTPTTISSQPVPRSPSQSKLDILSGLSTSQSSLPIEKFQGIIKQKEGEVTALQEQLASLEKTKGID
jgi:hypothetical protein